MYTAGLSFLNTEKMYYDLNLLKYFIILSNYNTLINTIFNFFSIIISSVGHVYLKP